MQLIAYRNGTQRLMGSLEADGRVREITDVASFYSDAEFWLATASANASAQPAQPLAGLEVIPAVPPTSRVICVGLNYKQHAQEVGLPWPEQPVIFGRWASNLVAGEAQVPQAEECFDWEGELAVVIGREARCISEPQALDAVLGYAAFNDLSARTWQMQSSQWTLGKCSDQSAPIGAIRTRAAAGDPAAGLRLTTRLNGELVQDGCTSDMIFSIPRIIAFVSRIMTLQPGDVIATGTPAGVGAGMKPPRFLRPQDRVEVAIETVGQVSTTIAEPWSAPAG